MTGFHGRAELCGHGVTVYLLPGMTRWQRDAVLRRLRMEASRGYGPALPLPELVFALAVDRVRTALRITVGAVRLHPSRTLLPSAAAVLLMAFFILASAGSRIEFSPRAGLDGLVSGGAAAVSAAPRQPAPRVERACFGAMPGVGSAQAVQLACKATTPPPAAG